MCPTRQLPKQLAKAIEQGSYRQLWSLLGLPNGSNQLMAQRSKVFNKSGRNISQSKVLLNMRVASEVVQVELNFHSFFNNCIFSKVIK